MFLSNVVERDALCHVVEESKHLGRPAPIALDAVYHDGRALLAGFSELLDKVGGEVGPRVIVDGAEEKRVDSGVEVDGQFRFQESKSVFRIVDADARKRRLYAPDPYLDILLIKCWQIGFFDCAEARIIQLGVAKLLGHCC